VFVNGTLEVRTYTLRNGSNFNVIYGRDTANVTPAQLTAFVYNGTLPKQTAVYNSTLLKLINAYNGTLLKNFNNSNRGKTYFNNTVFFNGTIQVRTYTLRNGSNFDVVYGNQGPSSTGISNNTDQGKVYLNSSNGVFVNGTLEVRTYTLRNGSVFNTIYGRFNNTWAGRNIVYNNTNQVKTYFNNSVFFNGTIQVRTYTLRNGSNF
ncbi:MAG: hypothetical protein AABY15_04310, partial [Nanoarchaeota archaeon]